MSKLKKLAGDTALYGLSSILGRFVNYLLVPLYTAVLSPAVNGTITGIFAVMAFLNVLYTMGMETAFFRFAKRQDKEQTELIFSQAQGMVTLISIGLSLLLILFAEPLSDYLGSLGGLETITWAAAILFLDGIAAIPLAKLRIQGRAKEFASLRLLNILLNVGLNLLFILVLLPSEAARPFLDSIGATTQPAILVLAAQLLSNTPYLTVIRWRWPVKVVRALIPYTALLLYAWPIALTGLAGMTNEMFGRLMLEKLLPEGFYPGLTNLEALGVYGQAYKLSIFMSLIIQAFRMGAEPFFFAQAEEEDSRQTLALVMRYFTLACCGILLFVSLNLDWIGPLLLRRAEYRLGYGVVPILLLANLFLGIYYNLSTWFKLTDRTRWGTYLSLGGMIITVGLNALLIPVMGFYGSAVATLVCYSLMTATSYLAGQRFYPVPYATGLILAEVAACVIAIGADALLVGQPLWIQWVYRGLCMAAYLGYVATKLQKRFRPSKA